MKFLIIFAFCLLLIQLSLADTASPELSNDTVSIGFVPARYDVFIKGEPYIVLEAKVLATHKNKEIENFFIALNKLASEGRTDNATQFHQQTVYIEAIYQGKRVRLFFSGDSHLDKYNHYEKQWKLLHGEIFKYLNGRVSPNYKFNSDAAKSAAPVN